MQTAEKRETIRQVWLNAMGLTPWVAHTPLAGAAPSPVILQTITSAEREAPAAPANIAMSHAATPQAGASAPMPQPVMPPAAAVQRSTVQPLAKPAAEVAPRLVVRRIEQTLLVAEQQDPQAPEPNRDEQQLLASLVLVFGKTARELVFISAETAAASRETLTGFAGGMAVQGCTRILFCLSERGCRYLLDRQPRFQPFQLSGLTCVVVSSLAEMLTDPDTHKRQSWQAMCEARLSG